MLTPSEINAKTVHIAENKAKLKIGKMLSLGILAGAFIAFAATAATFGNAYVGKLAGACIFPAGLAMVVIAGSELFTGNCLMFSAVLQQKITMRQMLKNWFFVYIGNFIGSLIVVLLVVYSGAFDSVSDAVINTATAKVSLDFWEAMLRGVLCNFLVCMAVWMSFAADTIPGKIFAVFLPVMIFVLCGFEHSIANMFYVPAGIFEALKNNASIDQLNLGAFLINNLLPVTIGNIVGGIGFVLLLMVGDRGVEPLTSSTSKTRSSQLS